MAASRLRNSLAIALLFALALLPALPATVAAQDGLSQAQALMDDARARSEDLEPLVDDESFALVQDAVEISTELLAADVADFYATYTLIVPRDGNDEPYDHGIEFRSQDDGVYQLVILSSTDESTVPIWGVLTTDDLIAEGEFPRRAYNTEPGDLNVVELAVIGEVAAFAVNGDVVDLIDLDGGPASGAVFLSTGVTDWGTIDGSIVEFEGVSFWSLDDGAGPPDDGGASDGFVSESFDMSLSWDDSWQLLEETVDAGEEYVYLSNGTSDIEVFAFESDETQAACIDSELDYLANESDYYSDVSLATNLDGEEMRGVSPDGDYDWAVIWATFVFPDGTSDLVTVFIRCQQIGPEPGVLVIRHITVDADYNGEIPARQAFLEGLEVGPASDGGGGAVNPDDEVATGDGEERPSTRDEEPTATTDTDALEIVLQPAGEEVTGVALFTPDGARTVVEVAADAPEGTLVSIQLGSCADLAGEEAFAAGELDESGESRARVRIATDELVGMYAITLVDADTLDFANPLACGDI